MPRANSRRGDAQEHEKRNVTRLALAACQWLNSFQAFVGDADRRDLARPCDIVFGAMPGDSICAPLRRLAYLEQQLADAIDFEKADLGLLRKSPARHFGIGKPSYHEVVHEALRRLRSELDAAQSWAEVRDDWRSELSISHLQRRVLREGSVLSLSQPWASNPLVRAIALKIADPTMTDEAIADIAKLSRDTMNRSDRYRLAKFLVNELADLLAESGVREFIERFPPVSG